MSTKGSVIFIDSVHKILFDGLTQDGWQCDWKVDCSQTEIESIIHEYEGAVIRSKFTFSKALLNKASRLKFIARSGSGLENIDIAYAQQKGIEVINSPEGNKDAVGEHALGMLLTLFNKLNQGDAEIRNYLWQREANRGLEIKGKTVGIIGFGQMGSAFAQRLSGFDCNIIAHDKYKTSFGDSLVTEVDLKTLFNQADIVSLHLPLAEETHYYANSNFFTAFKKPFYLINTSRGNVVETKALVEAIKQKKVLGACLDVLEYESSSFQNELDANNQDLKFLLESNKTILSPHVAGWTVESFQKLSEVLLEKVRVSFN